MNYPAMKFCPTCERTLAANKHFRRRRDATGKDVHAPTCAECTPKISRGHRVAPLEPPAPRVMLAPIATPYKTQWLGGPYA